ncbi:hypothetical protein DLM45_15380 [Hyphomicrobium methylovorum]|uniref:VPS10 domain-containing protein n=1 Tax=Hyphomicrobium methylovorum TaxID=84 RepID=UPI0015E79693|nr:sialidase family protein [Hyphomicrobium methylovorum]MBA2127593.1 hypothetical protein [Hyphomicrobium methylovorum]
MRWFQGFVVCVAVIVFSGIAGATGVLWTFAGWYGGGCYPNIVFDPVHKGRMYLASDVAGMWRSDDGGERWSFITRGLNNLTVSIVEVSPANSDILFAATQAGVSVSTDAGGHWQALDNLGGRIGFERPANYRSILLDRADDNSICVGTAKGEVFCSSDRGSTWDDLKVPPSAGSGPVVSLQRLMDASGLIAARADGVHIFHSATRSWTSATPLPKVTDLIPFEERFLAASDGAIWESDGKGERWSRIPSVHPSSIFRIEYSASAKRVYAVQNKDWSGKVFYSNMDLSSWRATSGPSEGDIHADPTRSWAGTQGAITSLKASPFEANVVFRTDWWGVWRSQDGGETWQEKIRGTPNTVGTDIVAHNDQTVLAATMDNGLLGSHDGGASFTALFPSTGYKDDENGHVWRIASPSVNRIVATSSPWNAPINQVLLSEDGGKTFEKIRTGLPDKRPVINTLWDQGYPRVLAIDPRNDKRFYLGIDGDDGGGLFISEDGARTWTRVSGRPPSLKFYSAFAVDKTQPGYLYWGIVGDKGGIYRSTDDGKSWVPVFRQSGAVFDMVAANDGAIYATGAMNGGAVFVSKDHGASWTTVSRFPNTETTKAIAAHPTVSDLVVVSTTSWSGMAPQHIYVSVDGGRNWRDITGDLPPGSGAAALAFSPDGKTLFLSRYAGSVYKIATDQILKAE